MESVENNDDVTVEFHPRPYPHFVMTPDAMERVKQVAPPLMFPDAVSAFTGMPIYTNGCPCN